MQQSIGLVAIGGSLGGRVPTNAFTAGRRDTGDLGENR
jgi:hypothetical protein